MSYLKRASSWLLTESGQKFCYYAAGTATTCVLLGHVLPHTILIEQYENLWHLYKHGFSVPVTKPLQERFKKALELAGIPEVDRHLFKPFAAYGFDIFSIGTSYSKFGVRIGIPAHFFYENEESVDKQSIKLRDESIIWDLEEGKLLLKSLVLSEKAQIYAIAREIKYRDTPKIMIDTTAATTSCLGMYGLARAINIRFNLYAAHRSWRLVLYLLVGMFSYGSYVMCKDVSTVFYEQQIDEELKRNDPVLAEGGKEFYTKLANRNIALRKLLGKEGERTFTALGNENYFIRYKHSPVMERKLFFEQS